MNKESGRSMVEMVLVLGLMGVITIGSIAAYQSGNDQNKANQIHELVSTASLNGLTKMRNLQDSGPHNVWDTIGKKKSDYGCIQSLSVERNGSVTITFVAGCEKVRNILAGQWGDHWNGNTYTPPRDEE